MLEQLVECENRLLEEQRRFNELLLAWRSGDLGDDLTRMKIDQMQREVDALGRQLTALRTVIAAQADRERAGYRQGRCRRRRMDGPAYGQPGAAAQPWDQTMPRPAAQTAEPGKPQQAYQQTPPQPAVQTAETGNPDTAGSRAQCHSPRGRRETRSRRISRYRRGRWQHRRDTSRHPGSRIWKKRSAGRFCRSALQD